MFQIDFCIKYKTGNITKRVITFFSQFTKRAHDEQKDKW